MLISIIIVNWNTSKLLHKCLETILKNSPSINKEIIVVDNASADKSVEMVKAEYPDVLLIESNKNVGYAEGNNIGLKHASGDFILLLNPDTEILPNSIEELVGCLERHPDASATAPRLIYPDGRFQRSCRGFPHPAGLLFDYMRIYKLFPKNKIIGSYRMDWFDYESEIPVDQPMASCILISRKAFNEIGGFDNKFPIFFNDVDWCYRSYQKGWKIYFTPKAEIIHHVGGSTSQVKPEMIRESHISFRKYYEKHYKGKISNILYNIINIAISFNLIISLRLKHIVGKH